MLGNYWRYCWLSTQQLFLLCIRILILFSHSPHPLYWGYPEYPKSIVCISVPRKLWLVPGWAYDLSWHNQIGQKGLYPLFLLIDMNKEHEIPVATENHLAPLRRTCYKIKNDTAELWKESEFWMLPLTCFPLYWSALYPLNYHKRGEKVPFLFKSIWRRISCYIQPKVSHVIQ